MSIVTPNNVHFGAAKAFLDYLKSDEAVAVIKAAGYTLQVTATGLPAKRKLYHLAKGAGHYGIFHGSKWRNGIAPVVEKWIADHS